MGDVWPRDATFQLGTNCRINPLTWVRAGSLAWRAKIKWCQIMKNSVLFLCLMGALSSSIPLWAASENGAAGDMPAYYDHELFTINFKELPAGGEAANLQHNQSINLI